MCPKRWSLVTRLTIRTVIVQMANIVPAPVVRLLRQIKPVLMRLPVINVAIVNAHPGINVLKGLVCLSDRNAVNTVAPMALSVSRANAVNLKTSVQFLTLPVIAWPALFVAMVPVSRLPKKITVPLKIQKGFAVAVLNVLTAYVRKAPVHLKMQMVHVLPVRAVKKAIARRHLVPRW